MVLAAYLLVAVALRLAGNVLAIHIGEHDGEWSSMWAALQFEGDDAQNKTGAGTDELGDDEAETFVERRAEDASFLQAPSGATQGLFIPARHACDEAQLKEYLEKYPKQGDKSEKRKKIEASLVVVHDVLEEHGLPTILEGGSTLGFFRNCGVIPSDADGDVAVLGHWLDDQGADKLAESFKARNATLHRDMCPKGVGYTGCEMRATFEDDSYVDLLVYAQKEPCEKAPCSYISPLWPGGSVGKAYAPCDTGPIHFEQAHFLDKVFWIQAPTNRYLAAEYGKEWEDPDSWGKYPDSHIYKPCNFDTLEEPRLDSFAGATPPASYVVGLQKI